jgi:hypothetical protein
MNFLDYGLRSDLGTPLDEAREHLDGIPLG